MNLVKNQEIAFEYPTNELRLYPTGMRTWRGTVHRAYKHYVLCNMTQDNWGRFEYEKMENVRIEG